MHHTAAGWAAAPVVVAGSLVESESEPEPESDWAGSPSESCGESGTVVVTVTAGCGPVVPQALNARTPAAANVMRARDREAPVIGVSFFRGGPIRGGGIVERSIDSHYDIGEHCPAPIRPAGVVPGGRVSSWIPTE